MDIDEAREFLRTHHHAVLITKRRDDSPQASPVSVGVRDDGLLAISTREPAMKTHNVLRDPTVSLCVLSDTFFGSWIQVDGTAEVRYLPEVMDDLVAYYRSVAGEHPNWDEYREAMVREKRVLLVVSPTRAGPNRSG